MAPEGRPEQIWERRDFRTGSASRIGRLYAWNSNTIQWTLVDDVVFCIMFQDNNTGAGTGKNAKAVTPDKFGINIAYTPGPSDPVIPNSLMQELKGGHILMKDLKPATTTAGGGNRK